MNRVISVWESENIIHQHAVAACVNISCRTYKNDGCIAYDVAEDLFDPGLICFSELWPDRESLTRHLNAPYIEPWRSIAKKYGLMERKFISYDIVSSKVV